MVCQTAARAGLAGSQDARRVFVQHLAIAAARLADAVEAAQTPGAPASRYRAAERRYRDLAGKPVMRPARVDEPIREPVIVTGHGPPVSLLDLLEWTWLESGHPVRRCGGIDRLLLTAAEQLLQDLTWTLAD